MKPLKPAFRKEVFAAKRNEQYGVVCINLPISYATCSIGFALITMLVVLFIAFAQFSEKYTVTGYVNSSKGVIKIYPRQDGIVAKTFVRQGDLVKKGDALYLIDMAYQGLASDQDSELVRKLQERQHILERTLSSQKEQLMHFEDLLHKQFITVTLYNQKLEEIRSLEREKNQTDMDIIKLHQQSTYIIKAPIAGVVSTVIYKQGQYTNVSKPMMKIVPENADLVAEILVPVRHSGFLERGNTIFIHYDAYPYERFGTYQGKLDNISQSILDDEEEDKPVKVGEPYYKAIARLKSSQVTIYGQAKKIQPGMTFSAVIVGAKKTIWQWILDPLYSFYGERFK